VQIAGRQRDVFSGTRPQKAFAIEAQHSRARSLIALPHRRNQASGAMRRISRDHWLSSARTVDDPGSTKTDCCANHKFAKRVE